MTRLRSLFGWQPPQCPDYTCAACEFGYAPPCAYVGPVPWRVAAWRRLREPRPAWGWVCHEEPPKGSCMWAEHHGKSTKPICGAYLSRLRWVLVGRCGQHGGAS